MNDSPNTYPANPVNVPDTVTAPSPAFKTEVKKVMGAITLFFVVYVVLILLSILLSIACVLLGIGLMGMLTNFIGLAGGLGIISIGIMVFVFLVKFIFSVKKFDTSGTIEITEQDQPVLFEFIRKLTADTQTQFPKKIILSADVNACVYYNDSFWSMIFPVKKNLQIGLGLVNTLTVSEFKAVMAHEFGHFSQRSMKLGSFVYNVNKVIYNMLYENKGFTKFLQGWGNLHWAIHIFMYVTVELVKGIQSILQKMYGFINKSYMSLSREMEFHADAVAASVSGGNHLVAALQKIEVSDACYNTVIQKANDWLKDKTVFDNIYSKHKVVMTHYAQEFNLPLLNNVPQLNSAFFKNFSQSRINIKNQWASHPTREDREEHLQQLNIMAEDDNRPAWTLFNHPASLQQQLTATLYQHLPADMREQSISEDSFRDKYLGDMDVYQLPPAYNGYFDEYQLKKIDLENLQQLAPVKVSAAAFNALFDAVQLGLLKSLKTNRSDAQTLEAISAENADIKTFDFDGKKYKKKDAASILINLQQEIAEQENQLAAHEAAITHFFYSAAMLKDSDATSKLTGLYLAHNNLSGKITEYTDCCLRIIQVFGPLTAGQSVSLQEAADMASELRKESNSLKPLLFEWIDRNVFAGNPGLEEKARKFSASSYLYFSSDSFFNNELTHLHELVNESMQALLTYQLKGFKQLLESQLLVYQQAVQHEDIPA